MERTANEQPGLFDSRPEDLKSEELVLYALGEFQDRGFKLAGRRLALDRLLGAFRRAFEHFDVDPLTDEDIANALEKTGAAVEELPVYIAKHPFRITVRKEVAERSLAYYRDAVAAGLD